MKHPASETAVTSAAAPTALPAETPVAVIGAGTMGAGIAQVAAQAGHPVRLWDARPGAAAEASGRLAATLRALAAKGKISNAEESIARITPVAALADLSGCGLAIEAIIEDMAAKKSLFADLASVLGETAILASNTSSLSLAAMARDLPSPHRFAGLHFFNPAPVMALVEVIAAPQTAPETLDCLTATARNWGKEPVSVRAAPGFIVNRCARPFYGEAWRLLTEGACDAATLDSLMREAGGFRLGPCELMDMIGHDIGLAVSTSLFEAFGGDPRYTPSWRQRELVEAGHLGRKTGRGLYDHADTALRPQPASLTGPAPAVAPRCGGLGPAASLARRLKQCLPQTQTDIPSDMIHLPGATLALTDGRLAAERAQEEDLPDLVLFDLALDYATVPRLAITGHDPAALSEAAGLLAGLGIQAAPVLDTPGLIVARTVAQLISEATLVADADIATPEAINLALRRGLNYPLGPFEWAQTLGWGWIARFLANLHRTTGEDRYRCPPALRRRAARS